MESKNFNRKIVDDIIWWIPFKKLRNNVREFLDKVYINDFILDKFIPKGYIKRIEIDLARHCNMSCYSCSHFSQLADEQFYDLNLFKKDIKRLYELTNGLVKEISMIGGEPLLNKNAKDYFKETRSYFKNTSINIITNGILLLKQDENFWKSCHDNQIAICPTKYPVKVNWDKIKELCDKYKVWFDFVTNSKEEKISFKTNIDPSGNQDFYNRFLECPATGTYCVQLFNGKIYTCPMAAKIKDFNNFFNMDIPISDMDSIDIYDNNFEQILIFLHKPIPLCKYCAKPYPVGPWRPSKKDIKEYL